MSQLKSQHSAPWRKPLLCLLAAIIVLLMFRLGVWQLGRAEEKREIVSQLHVRSELPPAPLLDLLNELSLNKLSVTELRFRNVVLEGQYVASKTIYVDNQVVNGVVGYQVYTPFKLISGDDAILVARGWVGVGETRESLPEVVTDQGVRLLQGRFNRPPDQPPLWDEKYSVADGQRWQFLPMSEASEQLGLDLFPLVVELAPDEIDAANLVRKWPTIDDQWVAKHQGYAFQWFAMAAAFLIASLVLLLRRATRKDD